MPDGLHSLSAAFVWALAHSLWQGAAAALGAHLLLRLARRRSPQARYRIACGALAALVAAFLLTFALGLGPDPGSTLVEGPEEGAAIGAWVAGGSTFGAWLRQVLEPRLGWVLAAWSTGFLLILGRKAAGLGWLYGACLGEARPASALWAERARLLARRAGIRGPVALRVSTRVDSPLVLGWLRPVILVPAGAFLGLRPEALEAVLAHELAHVRRMDFLANLLQAGAEALFFYHPAVLYLSRQVRQEREHCCDDAAARACGDPLLYASALLELEELRSNLFMSSNLAPAARGGSLMQRIQRLVAPLPVRTVLSPAFFAAILLGLGAGGTLLLARTPAAQASGKPVAVAFNRVVVKEQPDAPAYPPEAKKNRIQGIVVVEVTLDAAGKVTGVHAVKGPQELRACAEDYASRWTFAPVEVKGRPCPVRFPLTMPFRLR